jgi:hypothetical protein
MWKKRLMPSVGIILYLGLILAIVLWWKARPDGPRTIQEAVAIARQKGLCCVGDCKDGCTNNHAVVSAVPLTWEQANSLRTNNPLGSEWVGAVRIYPRWRGMMDNYDPRCSVVWGELFVYGDPQLIEELTGRLP